MSSTTPTPPRAEAAAVLMRAAEALLDVAAEARLLVSWPEAAAARDLARAAYRQAEAAADLGAMRETLARLTGPLASGVEALESRGWGACLETAEATAARAAIFRYLGRRGATRAE